MEEKILLEVVVGDPKSEAHTFTLERSLGLIAKYLVENIVVPGMGLRTATHDYNICVDDVPVFPGELIPYNAKKVVVRFVERTEILGVLETIGAIKTILVVEPDRVFCSTFVEMLTDAGYIVITAHNVTNGLRKIKAMGENLSLVITDWFSGSGYEIIAETEAAGLPYLIIADSLEAESEIGHLVELDSIVKPHEAVSVINHILKG